MPIQDCILLKEGYQRLRPSKEFPILFECQACFKWLDEPECINCAFKDIDSYFSPAVVESLTITLIKWK